MFPWVEAPQYCENFYNDRIVEKKSKNNEKIVKTLKKKLILVR